MYKQNVLVYSHMIIVDICLHEFHVTILVLQTIILVSQTIVNIRIKSKGNHIKSV